MKIPKYL